MMMLVDVTNPADAGHGVLVTDVTTQCVAGVGGINHYAAFANHVHRLPDQTRLRIFGVNFQVMAGHN